MLSKSDLATREYPVFKHLALSAILSAPSLAFAGQGMSLDEGLAAVRTVAENDALMAPMQEAGGTSNPQERRAARSVDEIDVHSAAPRPAPPRGTDAAGAHTHKVHGKGWQSLLPGTMK